MNDCVDGDMRDMLPDLVSGNLPAGDAARVQEHVLSCAECAAEVELLRTARAAMRLAPTMDTTRIAGAVQASTAQRLAARRVPARVARIATLSLVVILAAVVLWPSGDDSSEAPAQTAAVAGVDAEPVAEPKAAIPAQRETRAPTQLALGGDMSGLEESELLTLLDEVSELEAMPGEEPASLSIEPVVPIDQEE